MFNKDLLIVDTETTGLVPGQAVICQWASIKLDKETLKEKEAFSTMLYLTPEELYRASPEAMRIHGFSNQQLLNPKNMDPKDLPLAILDNHGHLREYDVWGMYIQFDDNHLKHLCKYHDVVYPWLGGKYDAPRIRDLQDYFVGLGGILDLPWGNAALRTMANYFDLNPQKNHDALDDVRLSAECLRKTKELLTKDISTSKKSISRQGKKKGLFPHPQRMAPICECGRPMILRKDKRGHPFYGCSGFSKNLCRKTKPYKI